MFKHNLNIGGFPQTSQLKE